MCLNDGILGRCWYGCRGVGRRVLCVPLNSCGEAYRSAELVACPGGDDLPINVTLNINITRQEFAELFKGYGSERPRGLKRDLAGFVWANKEARNSPFGRFPFLDGLLFCFDGWSTNGRVWWYVVDRLNRFRLWDWLLLYVHRWL